MSHKKPGPNAMHRVSDLLSVVAYDEESHLYFMSDQSLGFGFMCNPLPGGDDSSADRINTLLNNDWPAGTMLQFTLWTSPDVRPAADLFKERRRLQTDNLLQEYTNSVANFVIAGAQTPIIRDADITTRDIKLLITCKVPMTSDMPSKDDMDRAQKLRGTMERALGAIGFAATPLTKLNYLRVMETIFNWGSDPCWTLTNIAADEETPLCQQVVDQDAAIGVEDEGINLGERYIKTLSVKRFPRRGFFGTAFNYLGDFFSGSRGIRENVMITATIHFPDAQSTKAGLETKRNWTINQAQGPLLKFIPELYRKKMGFDALHEAFQDGDRPVQIYLGMVLFAKDKTQSYAAASNAKTYWAESGFQLAEDRFVVLPCFLNCLPFEADRDAVRDLHRYRTMATRHAIPLLPLFGDWKGTGTPDFMLYSRNGQVMSMSLFDSDASYNGVIAAQSGSGKSFLTNEIISAYLSQGGQVWVVDVGGSYKKTCELFEGDVLEFEADHPISINPFPLVSDYSDEEDILTGLVVAMAAPNQPLSDFQLAETKRYIKEVWSKYGKDMSIDNLAEAMIADKDQRVQDVGRQLYPFTTAGEYGRYLSGKNTVSFQNRLNVLELEALKGRRHLQQVVLLELIYQIQQTVYHGERNRPKLVIIDEAWDLLSGGGVAAFINDAYRRFRKYGAAAIVILQSINDLYENPVGRAIAENSPNTYLLGQKSEAIESLKASKRLALSESGYSLLKTVHTIKGVYSEIYCVTNRGTGIGRLVVDPFRALMYSTDAKDVHAIKQKQDKGMGIVDAIKAVLAERGRAE